MPNDTIQMYCQISELNVRASKVTGIDENLVGTLHENDVVTVLADAERIGHITWRTITEGEYAGNFAAERFLNFVYLVEVEQEVSVILGADVSHHQRIIDWAAMRDKGIRFAFIKATDGDCFTDDYFVRNATQAGSYGIITGAYHYYRVGDDLTTARVENDPARQAEFFFSVAKDQVDLPLVVDVEGTLNPRPPSPAELKRFLDRLEALSGQKPIIYTSYSYWEQVGNPAWSVDYPLWVANWTRAATPRLPHPWEKWLFWQYTSEGNGAEYGVSSSRLDLDRFHGSMEDLCKLAGVVVSIPTEDEVEHPLLSPIVEKRSGNQTYYSFNRAGNDEQRLGVNGRRFAFLDIAPELVQNGTSWPVLVEQLNAANNMNAAILRVYAKHKSFDTQTCIHQMRKLLNELSHRFHEMRALIVLNDSLTGAQMFFEEEMDYHSGPQGHLSTEYWTNEFYKQHFEAFLRAYVPAVLNGYEDVIFGFQIINEPQLTQAAPRPIEAETQAFIYGIHYLCELVYSLAGDRLPVGTGLRHSHDVVPFGSDHRAWSEKIHDSPYITFISGNIYQERNSSAWCERNYCEVDMDIAHETRRPYLFTEMGTSFNQPGGMPRESVVREFYEWAYQHRRVYACLPWALQYGMDRGFGSSESGLTWEVQGRRIDSTPAVFSENVHWGHTRLPTLG